MDEITWWAAMAAVPGLRTLGAFADWLDERADPRADATRLLFEFGVVSINWPELHGYG